jgi:hypothetical protein
MFPKLAKTGLVKFWLVQPPRITPGAYEAGRPAYCNDNLPAAHRAIGRCRPPALACHWLDRDGRLECCWHRESGDAPRGGMDGQGHSMATGGDFGRRAVSAQHDDSARQEFT